GGDRHRLAVDVRDPGQLLRAQQDSLGGGDRGERVAGADHLHRPPGGPGRDHRVGHLGDVARGQHVLRMDRDQPAPVRPGAHGRRIGAPGSPVAGAARLRSTASSPDSAAIAPLSTATPYAGALPWSSIRKPASAAPGAMPAPSPVWRSPRASVSRERGAISSIAENSAMIVGEIAKPATNSRPPIVQRFGTNGVGSIARVSARAPTQNRRIVVTFHAIAPVSTPERRLPSAQTASSTPEITVCPFSSANATVATSVAPNSDPSAAPPSARGLSRSQGIGARWAGSGERGCGGGSVPRWAARPRV